MRKEDDLLKDYITEREFADQLSTQSPLERLRSCTTAISGLIELCRAQDMQIDLEDGIGAEFSYLDTFAPAARQLSAEGLAVAIVKDGRKYCVGQLTHDVQYLGGDLLTGYIYFSKTGEHLDRMAGIFSFSDPNGFNPNHEDFRVAVNLVERTYNKLTNQQEVA